MEKLMYLNIKAEILANRDQIRLFSQVYKCQKVLIITNECIK